MWDPASQANVWIDIYMVTLNMMDKQLTPVPTPEIEEMPETQVAAPETPEMQAAATQTEEMPEIEEQATAPEIEECQSDTSWQHEGQLDTSHQKPAESWEFIE